MFSSSDEPGGSGSQTRPGGAGSLHPQLMPWLDGTGSQSGAAHGFSLSPPLFGPRPAPEPLIHRATPHPAPTHNTWAEPQAEEEEEDEELEPPLPLRDEDDDEDEDDDDDDDEESSHLPHHHVCNHGLYSSVDAWCHSSGGGAYSHSRDPRMRVRCCGGGACSHAHSPAHTWLQRGCRGDGCRGDGYRGDGCRGDGCRGDGCRGDGCRGDGCRDDGCRDDSCRGDGCRGDGSIWPKVSVNVPHFSLPPAGGLSRVRVMNLSSGREEEPGQRRNVRLPQNCRNLFITFSSDVSSLMLPFRDFLTEHGFHPQMDSFINQTESLSNNRWTDLNLLQDSSCLILVVVSPKYREDVEGRSQDHHALHTRYIHNLMQTEFIQQQSLNFRFIPVLFLQASQKLVPSWLQNTVVYHWPRDQEKLLLRLLRQEPYLPPPVPTELTLIIRPVAPPTRLCGHAPHMCGHAPHI